MIGRNLTVSDEVRAELEQIKAGDPDQRLKPRAVLEFAREHPDSYIHDMLEWNDATAGDHWRLLQIASVIRAVVVTVPTVPQPVRAYISVPSHRTMGGGFVGANEALAKASWFEQLADECLHEIKRLQTRFALLTALRPLFEQMTAQLQEASKPKSKSKRGKDGDHRPSA